MGRATIRAADGEAMTRDSSKPLLLNALLKGLANAVQRDDLSSKIWRGQAAMQPGLHMAIPLLRASGLNCSRKSRPR